MSNQRTSKTSGEHIQDSLSCNEDSDTYSGILGKRLSNDNFTEQLRSNLHESNETSLDDDIETTDRRKRR